MADIQTSKALNVGNRVMQHVDVVFVKLVPSGKLENRILEAAYVIYNPKTRERIAKHFIFFHQPSHEVYGDTFSDYHTAPTESDGRSLLQLCKDKSVAKNTIQDFCTSFSTDLNTVFPSAVRHITFVGDHIWQTRSLLYRFMFCQSPWIKLRRRSLVHFVEFRTFMQPFAVMHAQLGVPFELPQWIFRAQADVNGQVNFFDNMVQMTLPRSTFSILHSGVTVIGRPSCSSEPGATPELCPPERAGECKMVDGASCGNPGCDTVDVACQTDRVVVVPVDDDVQGVGSENDGKCIAGMGVGMTSDGFAVFENDCRCHSCQ